MSKVKNLIATLLLLALLLGVGATLVSSLGSHSRPTVKHQPTQSVSMTPIAPPTKPNTIDYTDPASVDYVTKLDEPADHSFKLQPGGKRYCELDELSRPVCAAAYLTKIDLDKARARGRQSIEVNPVGWPAHNNVVDVISAQGIKVYHGWFYNRSHLLADSFGGDPVKQNLITGTRAQNVGLTKRHSGGMAGVEDQVRAHFKDYPNCPLYYEVRPVYTGDELIPRTVSASLITECGEHLSAKFKVYNSMEGYNIDYRTGLYIKR